jgi:hypothetical protein
VTDRRYRLASRPIHRGYGRPKLREIRELADDGTPPRVVVVVADADAMDVRQALERACQDGREDRAGEIMALRDYLIAQIAQDARITEMRRRTSTPAQTLAARLAANRATLAKMTELTEG